MAFGPFQHLYPYANFHDLNLDWILSAFREMETQLQQFVSLNTVKYADPLQWDITRQYATNTVVVDQYNGTAYLSVQPVPSGVQITDTDYWTPIFSFENFISSLETRVTNIESNIKSLNVYNFDTCVFIGDSYLNQNPSWGDQLASILPGCRAHYNYPSGGAGFQTAGANGSFLDIVSNGGQVYNAVQSFKNEVTFVLIEGGVNDGDRESSPESLAVANTLNAVKALFPNAKIAVVYNWAPRAYPNTIWHGIARGCADTGVPFCPNSYLWLWNNDTSYWFQSDQIHPSAAGTNMAVRLLYMWLMNGKVDWPFTSQVKSLSNGMSLIWYIDSSDQVCIGIYGISTSNTAALGTAPFCLRPFQQQIFFPWLNVTNLSGTVSPYVKINPGDGAMSTNATFSSQTNVSQWNTSIPARQFGFMGFTQ